MSTTYALTFTNVTLDTLGLPVPLTTYSGSLLVDYATGAIIGSLQVAPALGIGLTNYTSFTLTPGAGSTYTITGFGQTAAAVNSTISIEYSGQSPVSVSTQYYAAGVEAASGTGGSISSAASLVPSVVPESASVLAGMSVSATAANGALKGDSDPSGAGLSITSVARGSTSEAIAAGGSATIAGAYGSLTLKSDGSYNYAPTNGLAIVSASGAPQDVFNITVSDGTYSSNSTLAFNTSLAAGSTETVTNASGSTTFSIGASTLTLSENGASTYAGTIQDGSSGNVGGRIVVAGPGTLKLASNSTFTGGTTISSGSVVEADVGGALSSGPVSIGTGAVLKLLNDTVAAISVEGTTFTGAGTIEKTGIGTESLGGAGTVTIALSQGGLIDVEGGVLLGNVSHQGSFAGNRASLNIASGALFNGQDGATQVDALTGSGTLEGGGIAGAGGTTIGVAGGSGTFSGTIANAVGGELILTKTGAGTEVLSGANTYTGGTILSGGTLELASRAAAGAIVQGQVSVGVAGNGASVQVSSGGIAFAGTAATLQIDAAALTGADYAAPITGFSFGDSIDLRGLAYASDDTATLAGAILTVGDANNSKTLSNFALTSGLNTAYEGFSVASDQNGGTVLTFAIGAPSAPLLAAGQDTGVSTSDNITSINVPTFTGTALPGGTVTLYDGSNVVGTAAVRTNGIYTVTPTYALLDGQHQIAASVSDGAGHTSAESFSTTITIETTAPTAPAAPVLVSDTGTSSTDHVTSNVAITYATPAMGDTLLYQVGNGAYSTTAPTFSAAGTYTVTTEEENAAGLVSAPSASLTFTLETAAPTAPAAPVLVSDTGTSSTDHVTSNSAITYATPAMGDTLLYQVGNGAYSTTAPTFSAPGTYTVTTEEENAAGLISAPSASLTFTLETNGPAAPVTMAETDAVVSGMTVAEAAANGALKGDTDPNGGTLSITQVSHGTIADPVAAGSTSTTNATVIAGAYGSLSIGADGSYGYAANNGLAIVTAADGSPITDTFGDIVTGSEGPSSPSSLAITTTLASGGTETVNDATGTAPFSIGATTLTLTNDQATSYGGMIQDGSSGNAGGKIVVANTDANTLTLTGTNTYIGGTNVLAGTVIEGDVGGALSSGPVAIAAGATVNLLNDTSGAINLTGTTFSGAGTLVKSGSGYTSLGGHGEVNVALTGLIDVEGGTLQGSYGYQASYANNQAGLNIAAGATFDGVEGQVQVGALTGAGTLQGGYAVPQSGYAAASTTIGAGNASGSFSGVIKDDSQSATLALTKEGMGTQVLTGTNTYTGGTSITGGTLQLGDGTSTGSIIGNVTDGGTLAFNEGATSLTFAGEVSGAGAVTQLGGTTTLTGTNTYTGGTNVLAGTVIEGDVGGALSSGPVAIAAGATVNLLNDTSGAINLTGTTFSGAGTLVKSGSGYTSLGGHGEVNVALTGLIDVEGGTLQGSYGYQASYANNQAGLNIAAGATFDGVEGQVQVGALTGAGTLQGGYAVPQSGYAAASTTIGAGNASGSFSGVIKDDSQSATLALTKEGTGTQVLTGTDTYTGGTSISGGTLEAHDNGSALSSGPVSIAAGATLDLDNDTTARILLEGTTLSGTGTIKKTGTGNIGLGGNGGTVNVALGTGGSIDVAAGTLAGSSYFQGNYANNLGGLTIGSGATFDGVEGTIVVGGLNGSGTLQGGYQGYGSTTIGAGDASGSFSGTMKDDGQGSILSLTKEGAGTQILTGSSTYTGGTTLSGGTLELGALNAAGSGEITFAGAATLKIDAAAETMTSATSADFANLIDGANSASQIIDLTSLAFDAGTTTASLFNGTLTVSNGTANAGTDAVTLRVTNANGKVFSTASDGHGGTLVYDPPVTAAASPIDTSWIAASMAEFGGQGTMSSPAPHDPYAAASLAAPVDTHAAALGAAHHA